MTADTTVDLIRRYYEAFNRRDIPGMLACVAQDIVHDVNQSERREGKERFHAYCERMSHHYDEKLHDVTVMTTPDGTRAAAEFNVRGTYLRTEQGLPDAANQRYAIPAGAFFAVGDGKIQRISTYYNLTEWFVQVSQAGSR